MELRAWYHQVKLILAAIILWIPAVSLAMYAATNTIPKTEGISEIVFRVAQLQARFDPSDVKDGVRKAATQAKGVATKVVSEAASKATAAMGLIDALPKGITVGSDQVCWQYREKKCQTVSSDIDSWFPKPARELLSQTSDTPDIPGFWTRINIQTCIAVSAVGLWLYFVLLCVAAFQVKIPASAGLYRFLSECLVALFVFTPLALAVAAIAFISDGLKRLSFLDVTDGDLSQWLLISFAFASISALAYAWHRKRAR
ncbi:hypothetical protein LRP88_07359 [Fusarium phalaenopsidis]